jgi:hypothetical protein
VFIAIKKFSELLKAAAIKGHVDVVHDLLKIDVSVKVSKKHVRAPS